MYEYKFVKLSFTKDEVDQGIFSNYEKIIEKHTDKGWKLNNLFQISGQDTENMDLIFEREKQAEKENKNNSKTELVIQTLLNESKTYTIDNDYWKNIKAVVGFFDWIEIYRKDGSPSLIFHYHYLRGLIERKSNSQDDKFTNNELNQLIEFFDGKDMVYFRKDSGFEKFFEIAKNRKKLIMTYENFGAFEKLGLEDVYYRVNPDRK